MKVVFLGATKGMGRALAQRMAARGDQLFLMGIEQRELDRSAKDLEARGASGRVGLALCDLLDMQNFAPALDLADEFLKGFDCVVLSAGLFASQEELERDPERCNALLTANFTNSIGFCEEVRRRLLARGGGTLCVFSSVAGERARKPVILYGASKAGLSYYLEGLDHKYRSEGLVTVTVKPGFVRTGMTAGLDPPPFAGEPEQVAVAILKAIDTKRPVVYVPQIWGLVMLIIRSLPRAIMRRIGF